MKTGEIRCYEIKQRYKKYKFNCAHPSDFTLGKAQKIGILKKEMVSPYSFDYEKKEFWFAEMDNSVCNFPFFYQDQFEKATKIVILPLDLAKDVYGQYVNTLRPTFIFSIGRCGSTLLSKLTKSIGKIDISEPDIFTSFSHNKKNVGLIEGDQILYYSLKALECFFDAPSSQLVIKLRTDCNWVCEKIYRNFPRANYIFLTREIYSWSKSFITAFGWKKDKLFGALQGGINALCFFKENNVEFHYISYEDLVANPNSFLAVLSKNSNEKIDDLIVSNVMSKHSQAGTRLEEGSKKMDLQDIENQAQEFLSFWNQNKPRDKLEYLGLNL